MSYLNRWSVGVPIQEIGDLCQFWGNPTGMASLQQCDSLSRSGAVAITLSISAMGSAAGLLFIAAHDMFSSNEEEDA